MSLSAKSSFTLSRYQFIFSIVNLDFYFQLLVYVVLLQVGGLV